MNPSPSSFSRKATSAPNDSKYATCVFQPKGMTSTGTGHCVPNAGESLLSSTMMISRLLDWATIFSRKKAPPPPLIRLRFGSTSSAPSIVISISGCSSNVVNGTPNLFASCSMKREQGMPTMSVNWPSRNRPASLSIANNAVLPCPNPTTMPDSIKDTPRAAACSLSLITPLLILTCSLTRPHSDWSRINPIRLYHRSGNVGKFPSESMFSIAVTMEDASK